MDVHAPGSDLSEFKAYIVSQLLWNSSRELGAMASEFLNGYYGLEGGVAVKNYMDTMTGSMKKEGYCRADDGQGVSFPVTSPFLSPAALLTSAAGFSQGLQASKTTPLYYDRLKRASMSTWFVILVRWDEMQQFASEHKVVWPMETTKRQAYVSYLAGANISAAMNGMFCWRYGGSKSSCWTTASDPWRTTGYLWQQVFNHSRLWCLPEKGPNACVYNWTSHRPCCDHCGDHPISNICLNDTRDPGSRGRRGITTAVPSYTLLKTDEAVVSFSPPVFLPNVTCTYCANWRTYRAGKTENSWQTAIIGDGRGHVSSDGGRTVIMMPRVATPSSRCPTAPCTTRGLLATWTASTTPLSQSISASSTYWNVSENGTVLSAHNDGPAASFTGLPSPLICNSSDCMYGAGEATWSQAARLADGTFVTCTAAIWLCGHFGVPADIAGMHAWSSNDSYHWTWVGRPASLTKLKGYPEWFGPGEGPNGEKFSQDFLRKSCCTCFQRNLLAKEMLCLCAEHDLTLLADEETLMVVFRIDGNDGVPPYCAVDFARRDARHQRPRHGHGISPSAHAWRRRRRRPEAAPALWRTGFHGWRGRH